jgi:hypothetical protein
MDGRAEITQVFEQILLDVFVNTENAQEDKRFWALDESCKCSKLLRNGFQIPTAVKAHSCVGGCSIETGEKCFKFTDTFFGRKVCATCTAMIIYYQAVYFMPTYQHDNWNEKTNSSHEDENAVHVKAMLNAVELM